MIVADKLAYSSQIREKSPFIKTIFAVGTLLLGVTARSWLFSLIVMLIMGYSTLTKSRISPIKYLKFMLVPGTFLVLSSLTIIFDFTKQPMGLFNVYIVNCFLVATKDNIIYATELLLTAISSVACLYFLSVTTPINDIIMVLRKCKVPWIIIEISVLMYRFIFVILEMCQRTLMAQNCRLGNIGMKNKIKDMGLLLASVFVRSFHKANRLFESMEARSYDGQIRVLWEHEKASSKEKVAVFVYFAVLVVIFFLLS